MLHVRRRLRNTVAATVWLGWPALFLSIALAVAYRLWVKGSWRVPPGLLRWYTIGIVVFIAHATEEFLTGLQVSGPALMGRTWTDTQYLTFNGVWLITFVAAAFAMKPTRPFPVLIVIFFTIAAGLGNGVIHLVLAFGTGGYFPGAWTAPLCFAVGYVLVRHWYAGPPATAPGRA